MSESLKQVVARRIKSATHDSCIAVYSTAMHDPKGRPLFEAFFSNTADGKQRINDSLAGVGHTGFMGMFWGGGGAERFLLAADEIGVRVIMRRIPIRGDEYIGQGVTHHPCPFHDDHGESLAMDHKTLEFLCITGCGTGGTFKRRETRYALEVKQ